MKSISIVGSTGSIGRQTLDVIRANRDLFDVVALTCDTNIHLLLSQIKEFHPKYVVITNKRKAIEFKNMACDKINILEGDEGLIEISKIKVDIFLLAIVGFKGVYPLLEALKNQNNIALANKESIVCAGQYVMKIAKENSVNILPVDSEHSAIWKCLDFDRFKSHKRIIITASGGAFRDYSNKQLENVTYEMATKHPTWIMGNKITLDSATLMNKGFEVIEAMHLFNTSLDKIEVIIHKQSIIHSMVEFEDNSIRAELSYPDMRIPIKLALTYPNITKENYVQSLDFAKIASLTFEKPDLEKNKCLNLALNVAKEGGLMPCVMCVSNDIMHNKFKNGEIKFTEIADKIEHVVHKMFNENIKNYTIDNVIDIIEKTKREAMKIN